MEQQRSRTICCSLLLNGICISALFLLAGCSWLKPPRQEKVIYYRVKPGDTLSTIGDRFHSSAEEIADDNGISDPRELQVAKVLRIPYREAPARGKSYRASTSSSTATGGGTARAALKRIDIGEAREHVGKLQWPVSLSRGKLSSEFGWRWFSFHEGIDIAAPEGTPIYAAHDGVVAYSDNGLRGYGNLIVIRGDGILTVYGHNRRNRVRKGERVRRGEHIADLGSTGKSTGPHVHFETRVKNKQGKNAAVDPMIFLR